MGEYGKARVSLIKKKVGQKKMRWLNKKLTQISVSIIEKMHWENTKYNRCAVSFFIGTVIGWMIILLTIK